MQFSQKAQTCPCGPDLAPSLLSKTQGSSSIKQTCRYLDRHMIYDIYICACYIYVYIYMYVYICIYVCMYICIYVFMYICIYVYMYICTSLNRTMTYYTYIYILYMKNAALYNIQYKYTHVYLQIQDVGMIFAYMQKYITHYV